MELRDRPTKTTPKQRIPQYTKSWQLRNAPVCYWGQLIGDVPLRIQSTYDVHCDSPATRNETTMFRCQEGPLQQKSMTSINLARSTAEEPERQSNALIIKGGGGRVPITLRCIRVNSAILYVIWNWQSHAQSKENPLYTRAEDTQNRIHLA